MEAQNKPAYSYLVHEGYGCECGCCGHRLILCDASGNELESKFEFTHPYSEPNNIWAARLCLEKWPEIPVRLDLCEVIDD